VTANQEPVELHENSTKEEVAEYIKNKTPLFVESVEFEGMSLCRVHPALVQADEDNRNGETVKPSAGTTGGSSSEPN
jgi:hypothetical protein